MAKKDHRSERALAAAGRLFKRKPDATTAEYRVVCEKADKAVIGKLTNREFNASYVLPFRRSKALKGRPRKKTKRAAARRATTTRATRGRRGGNATQRIADLIRERDLAIMDAANDPRKAYEIASKLEEFAGELVRLAGG